RANLIFDPGDRRLLGNARGATAKALACGMQRKFRDGRSHSQHAYIGTVPSQLRIARKGAGDHVENETCTHAVPDQDDFIESALARAREQEVGELIDPRIDIATT